MAQITSAAGALFKCILRTLGTPAAITFITTTNLATRSRDIMTNKFVATYRL